MNILKRVLNFLLAKEDEISEEDEIEVISDDVPVEESVPVFYFEGKNIAIVEIDDIEDWRQLDNLIDEGWTMKLNLIGGYPPTNKYIIFEKRNLEGSPQHL